MLAIDKGRPSVMNLKELLRAFIDHRFEVITRRTQFELKKAEARAHILEGLKIAIEHMDDVVKIIRKSNNRDEAKQQLMATYELSEIQTNAILDMRLYQLTGLEREKVEKEYLEIIKQINYLRDLLENESKLYDVIKDDLLDLDKKYNDKRRTELLPDEGDINIEDLIEDRPCVITISHSGYIKRVPISTYREQRRGGKGVVGMDTKDEDYVEHVFTATTHDTILFFTQKGRVYWKKVYEVPESSRTARGKAMINFLDIKDEEKIAAMIRVREFSDDMHLIMATRNGIVKKSKLSAYKNPRAGGIIAILIDEDDDLIGVKQTRGDDHIILVTHHGMSIRFDETQLRDQGRATRGVKGITLAKEKDRVESIEVIESEGTLLAISENGFGKRTNWSEYPVQKRGGKGVITLRTTERNGMLVAAHTVREEDTIMLITEGGQMIRMPIKDLRVISRNTQGVKLINLDDDDKLVSATPVEQEDEEEINEITEPLDSESKDEEVIEDQEKIEED